MKFGKYVPERGDVVWLEFDPQVGTEVGTEIQKTCPALTLSPKSYNEKSGLALFVPITSSIKGYPFEVHFKDKTLGGVILADQAKSFDWVHRNAKKITTLEEKTLTKTLEMVRLLLH